MYQLRDLSGDRCVPVIATVAEPDSLPIRLVSHLYACLSIHHSAIQAQRLTNESGMNCLILVLLHSKNDQVAPARRGSR